MKFARKLSLALAAMAVTRPALLLAQVSVAPTFQGAVDDIRTKG